MKKVAAYTYFYVRINKEVIYLKWLGETQKYKDDFIRDLRGLLAIPSLRNDAEKKEGAPFGNGPKEALDYMLRLGEREGFKTKNIDGYAGVIEYGEGEESIGVLGHLDIVPIGEGWTKDPFKGEIIDGYMFGRGTGDDKGPGMAGFYALKMLHDNHVKLNKKIMLIYGCDEESGMECMDYYVKHGEVPKMGFVPDANFPLIYGEKGGLHIVLKGNTNTVITSMHAGERPNIVIGRASLKLAQWDDQKKELFDFYLRSHQLKGNAEVQKDGVVLMIEGVFTHAATPYNGVNAALHLLNFVGQAYHDKFAADTYEMLRDWQGKPLGIDMEGAYMGFLTMNTGIVNIENGQADITIDIRYPNDADVEKIANGFKNKMAELNYDLDFVLESDSKPLFVDPKSELVTKLEKVYREYTKDDFTPIMTMGGGTYARKLPNFVAYGPEFPTTTHDDTDLFIGGPHQKDEAVKIDDLIMAIAIYAAAIEELAQ